MLFGLLAVAVLGLTAITSIERCRRWRADRRGFADFLNAGAPLKHDALIAAFDAPQSYSQHNQLAAIVPMGDLAVPSGRIIVEDPSQAGLDGESPAEFDMSFPIGRFPVEALVLTANEDQRIAAVRVRFTAGCAQTLEPAFTQEWRVVQAARRRELPWFSIDSATAAIGTPESFGWMLQRTANDDNSWGELVPGPADGANPYLTGQPRDLFRRSGPDAANLFVVLSGMGDGTGSCYIQRDSSQRVISLIVDFGMVGQPEWDWPAMAGIA